MKVLIRSIICAILSVSLAVSLLPLQANVLPPSKTDCCAKMQAADHHKGCGKEAPKLPQDQNCCVACVFCVAAFLNGAMTISEPAASEQWYATFSESVIGRAQRPPVPPPRGGLS